LARLHGLIVEEREDRDAFVGVDLTQSGRRDREEATPGCAQRPLTSRVALHLHAVTDDGARQPRSGFFLVEIAGLDGQHVQLVPRRGQDGASRRRVELSALAPHHPAVGVAHVVTEHGAGEALDAARLAPLGDGLHRVFTFDDSGWPFAPVRAAWISARLASAISGALRAPRSSPMGTRARLSWASLTPSSARNFRMVAPPR